MGTKWEVRVDPLLRKVTLTVETDDPHLMGVIEGAVRDAGVAMLQELAPGLPVDEPEATGRR